MSITNAVELVQAIATVRYGRELPSHAAQHIADNVDVGINGQDVTRYEIPLHTQAELVALAAGKLAESATNGELLDWAATADWAVHYWFNFKLPG